MSWSTTAFDCGRDPEICWWGTWCCCLLSTRNAGTFGVGSNSSQAIVFIISIAISILLFSVNQFLSLTFLTIALITNLVYRIWMRSKIRELSQIPPSPCEDIICHCCCPTCLICQEAREAKIRGYDPTDFLCGEKLVTIEVMNENPTSSKFCITEEESASFINQKSFLEELLLVSKTSKIILISWCCLSVISAISLILSNGASNIGVLLLVFVQPMIVFYFLYWRSRRQYASLDYVIKIFICGFFFATLQSIFFETVLQFLVGIFIAVLIVIFFGSDVFGHLYSDQSSQFMMPTTKSITQILFSLANSADSTEPSTDQNEKGKDISAPASAIFAIALIYCFLNAYLVAAGVEETMKFFVVKFCSFPREIREPDTVLVYLMMAALGFATSENIEYVFGTKVSPIPHTSLLVGELFVLLIRVLMPVHLICSVLQASNLAKNIVGQASLSTVKILLPAIFLHGTYDFALFVLGAVDAIFKVNQLALTIVSIVIPVLITIAGIVWAYFSFSSVTSAYKAGFRRAEDSDIDAVVAEAVL